MPFTFSAAERAAFNERGFTHTPSRCAACRAERRQRQEQVGGRRPPPGFRERREGQHAATCAVCGAHTVLHFAPAHDKPVYCGRCYAQRRKADAGHG